MMGNDQSGHALLTTMLNRQRTAVVANAVSPMAADPLHFSVLCFLGILGYLFEVSIKFVQNTS